MDQSKELTSITSIIREENQRVMNAGERLGPIVAVAHEGLVTLGASMISFPDGRGIIAGLLLATQKSALLAFLSYLRGHTAQADFNCRQVIEFTAVAAYLLANPEADVFDEIDGEFRLKDRQNLSVKAYKWLARTEPDLNSALARIKKQINDNTAHAGIALTALTVDMASFDEGSTRFSGHFFDNLPTLHMQSALLNFCYLIVMVVETVRRAGLGANFVVFDPVLEGKAAHLAQLIEECRLQLAKSFEQSEGPPA
ncbi:hypothetical protein NS277_13465 [Novosphingobium barchaimii]|nr:hypothetical protein NS277_13465 [Novosphingobium barchaimii]